MKLTLKTLTLAITAAFMTTAASAGIVSIQSQDGQLAVTGEIVGVEGDTLVLETSAGTIRLGAKDLQCKGESCPSTMTKAAFKVAAR